MLVSNQEGPEVSENTFGRKSRAHRRILCSAFLGRGVAAMQFSVHRRFFFLKYLEQLHFCGLPLQLNIFKEIDIELIFMVQYRFHFPWNEKISLVLITHALDSCRSIQNVAQIFDASFLDTDIGINIQGDQSEYLKTFLYSIPMKLLYKY
jgi:hypothetical protein